MTPSEAHVFEGETITVDAKSGLILLSGDAQIGLAGFALAAIQAGVIPATIGTDTPDPALPGYFVVIEPLPAGEGDVMLLSESFGRRCAALVLCPA